MKNYVSDYDYLFMGVMFCLFAMWLRGNMNVHIYVINITLKALIYSSIVGIEFVAKQEGGVNTSSLNV